MILPVKHIHKILENKKLIDFCEWHNTILNKIKSEGIDYKKIEDKLIDLFGVEKTNLFFSTLSYKDIETFYNDKSNKDVKDIITNKTKIDNIFNTLLNENTIIKPSKPKFDVTKDKKSIASAVENIIPTMDKKSLEELKTEFTKILNSADVYSSDKTKDKWMKVINTSKNKISLMSAISNLYLKGANLGVSESTAPDLINMDKFKTDILQIQKNTNNNLLLHDIKMDNDKVYGYIDINNKMYKIFNIKDDLYFIKDYTIDNASELNMDPGFLGNIEEITNILKTTTQI